MQSCPRLSRAGGTGWLASAATAGGATQLTHTSTRPLCNHIQSARTFTSTFESGKKKKNSNVVVALSCGLDSLQPQLLAWGFTFRSAPISCHRDKNSQQPKDSQSASDISLREVAVASSYGLKTIEEDDDQMQGPTSLAVAQTSRFAAIALVLSKEEQKS